MAKYLTAIFCLFCLSILIMSCEKGLNDKGLQKYLSNQDIPESVWKKLDKRRIFFGHRSVGSNIIDGISELSDQDKNFKIINMDETSEVSIEKGMLAHASIGENRWPETKIKGFEEYLDRGIGKKIDVAAMKFCYVDFSERTDIDELFGHYKNAINQLRKKYPEITFVHITTPIISRERGFKPKLKRILGRKVRDATDNTYRMAYNDLMIKEYKGKEPIFDLARYESTLSNNDRTFFEKNGKKIFELAPVYTNDGSHLNSAGSKIIAEKFLLFLADLSK